MRMIPKSFLIGSSFLVVLMGCGSTPDANSNPTDGSRSIVVTYSVLGSVVEQLVGDLATVSVIIPDGQDPHEFEPSAKDIESLNNADLVVANGLDFEEGLEQTIDRAIDSGVNVFMVGDHITVRQMSKDEDHGHDEDHDGRDHGFAARRHACVCVRACARRRRHPEWGHRAGMPRARRAVAMHLPG